MPSSASRRSALGYRPALDGLRAIAIAGVVLYHAGGIAPGGYLGVDLFFVLSGFLITTILLDELERRRTVSLRDFYLRRARRLFPALAVLLAVFVLISSIGLARGDRWLDQDLFGVAAGIGYFANFALMTEPASQPMPDELRHLWSLAAEEQFYLLWPPTLVLLVALGRPTLTAFLLGVAIGVLALRQLALYADGASIQRLQFGADTRGVSIVVGCLLGLLMAHRGFEPSRIGRRLAPLALVCMAAFFAVDLGRELFLGPLLLFAACGALVILGALDDGSRFTKALGAGGLVYLGRISYALYLWHVPVFVVLGITREELEVLAVPAVLVSLVLAMASFHLVEQPVLRRRRRNTGSQSEQTGSLTPAPAG